MLLVNCARTQFSRDIDMIRILINEGRLTCAVIRHGMKSQLHIFPICGKSSC